MPPAPESLDWRDYITLREPDPMYRAQFGVILDRIARTPEGRELIKKAREVSGSIEMATSMAGFTLGGKPMPPTSGIDSAGGAMVFRNDQGRYEGKITVDLGKPGSVGHVGPDGKPFIESQTAIIVHELYHLADPNHLPHVRLARYREAIREELGQILRVAGADPGTRDRVLDVAADHALREMNLTIEAGNRDPKVLEQINVEMAYGDFARNLRKNPALRFGFLADMQRVAGAHAVTIQKPGATTSPEVGFVRLRGSMVGQDDYPEPATARADSGSRPELAAGAASPPGRPPGAEGGSEKSKKLSAAARYEEQAVDFTDRFMKKYFGEPPRQGYGNLFGTEPGTPAPREPDLLPRPTPDDQLPRYQPEQTPPSLKGLPRPLAFGQTRPPRRPISR
jgi:hypothetical protein